MEILGYVIVICVGIVLGSIGAGGSMLAVPVLVYIFSLDMETASAYSLFLVGVTSLTGAAVKRQQNLWLVRDAVFFGVPSVAGSFLSRKWLILLIPDPVYSSDLVCVSKEHLLLGMFSVLMVTASGILLMKKSPDPEAGALNRRKLLLPGLLVGLTAGLVGAGGGFLIVPALVLFARMSFPAATGTSLLIIACNALIGFCGDLMNRSIDWTFLATVTILAVLGLLAGCHAPQRLSSRPSFKYAFAWFNLTTGIIILIRQLVD